MNSAHPQSIWKQPMQVWAVAFAAVVAFMGIGLVDPILPTIAEDLSATAVETELLFTSYLVVTGVAMFFTSWVSSRIGAKATLLIGLAIIVAFALACALSGSVDAIIGFRGGWGLGNALFMSTALATIVGAAAGGSGAAIVLYEAALGVGIAVGPLLGGLLGSWSWRGPFFGVAALMAVAFIGIVLLLKGPDATRTPVSVSAPFRALATPSLGILAFAALFYNIGFFTLLAFSPFILGFDEMGIGLTFFGWGVALAVTSVWGGPWLMARLRRTTVLLASFTALILDLVYTGLVSGSPTAVVIGIIVGGLILGVINTTLTEAVMEASDWPRAVASSSYSGVRFLGGAIAPPLAAALWHMFGAGMPYYVGALSVLVAIALIAIGRPKLRRVDERGADELEDAEAAIIGDTV